MSDESLEPEGKIDPEDLVQVEVSEEDSELKSNPVSEVALEVTHGKWGVGQERRKRLAEAGYDVKEVEAEVVRLLNKK